MLTHKKFSTVSGGIFFVTFMNKLLEAIIKRGGSEESIFNAFKSDSKLIGKIAEVVMNSVKVVKENVLRVFKGFSLSERIKKGKYDWTNSDINEKNFPETVPADYDAEYKLFHFNRNISSEDAIKEMEKEGYRPGNINELLALGEAKPELQREFPIVELGSLWQNSVGNRNVAILSCFGDKRGLALYWFVLVWNARSRFLGVRK